MARIKRNINRNIGSVSSGTMLSDDLIPAFIAELQYQRPCKREHRKLIRDIESRIWDRDGAVIDGYWESDECDYDLEALFDALETYAPEGFYFGSHPGDGADYGYWLSEAFSEDFDGLKVDDLSDVPHGYAGGVLVVNDHGNMSLYNRGRNGHLYERWAIV